MPFWNSSRHRRVPHPLIKVQSKSREFSKFLMFAVIIGGLSWFLLASPILKVQDVKITGLDEAYASETHDFILGSLKNRGVYMIKKDYLVEIINGKYPNIKLNEVKYDFPNKFEISLSERERRYHIQASNGVFVADDEGFVLGTATEASPTIDLNVIYDKSLEIGQKIEDASLQAALIYSDLNQSIKIENDQIQMDLENGGKIILPQNAAVSKVNEFFTLLQKIIQKYTIDNRQIEFIDLRFSKPVIKYL